MKADTPIIPISILKISISTKPVADGYPSYLETEDIYQKGIREANTDPEEGSIKKSTGIHGKQNEKSFQEDMSGSDLDVPGAELDDADEAIGSEDEENNHYSLGGDNHNDLEEEKE